MASNLSGELSDRIIDYLHDDRTALCICGLVCKQWYQSSRYHLFVNVVIRDEIDAAALSDLLVQSGSAIAPCLQTIEIEIDFGPLRFDFAESDDIDTEGYKTMSRAELNRGIAKGHPVSTLPLFRFVKELTLQLARDINCTWDMVPIASRSWLVNLAASLTVLRLKEVEFSAIQDIMELVASACELRELYIPDCGVRNRSFTGTDDPNILGAHKAPRLHTLMLTVSRSISEHGGTAGTMLRWIEFHHPQHILHRIFITPLGEYEITRLANILAIAGSRVEHLVIAFDFVLTGRM